MHFVSKTTEDRPYYQYKRIIIYENIILSNLKKVVYLMQFCQHEPF